MVREQTEQSLFSSGVFTWGGKDQTLEILSRPIKNPLIIKKKGQKKVKKTQKTKPKKTKNKNRGQLENNHYDFGCTIMLKGLKYSEIQHCSIGQL